MRIAYVRVSSIDQNESRQIDGLKDKKIDKFFIEKVSGKDMKRPQLQAMLDFAREGDTIFIHDLSRLARNVADLLQIIKRLEDKKIGLVSNKENIDTSTPTGKLLIVMIAAINEFERDVLRERQAEGIFLAKQKGVYKGRKRVEKPSNWDEVINLYLCRKLTAKEAQNKLGLKPNVFYNFLNEEKEKKSLFEKKH